ncbi:MAG TPA: hypothetical protein VGC60_17020 [Pyrinomonadaceae bacterium]
MKSLFNESQPHSSSAANPTQLRTTSIEWLIAAALFASTTLVVVWQNAHVAVLWDLSYVLDNSYRIALGQIPYRDFPFAHPPLTFLVQAAIIKLSGRVFWHHVAYCALVGGTGTFLTWRILRRILADAKHQRSIALLLSLPLVPLGIYSVFPHPFYDPDCTLAILVGLILLVNLGRRPRSILIPIMTGAAVVIPLFVKQNTGLAFLSATSFSIIALIVWQGMRREPIRHYLITLFSSLTTLAIAIVLIHRAAGLGNYWQWTIRFAAERRTPARGEMLGIYADKMILGWLAFIVAGIVLFWLNRNRNKLLLILTATLVSVPFIWPAIYLLRDSDSSERADRLINIWPVLLIVCFISALVTIRRRKGISQLLPFVVISAIHGCFMSQQLWGSTYAIWPLLMILIAMTLADLSATSIRLDAGLVLRPDGRTSPPSKQSIDSRWLPLALTTVIAFSLTIAGAFYVRSHERLSYANLDEGELQRATLPQLKGLSTRGDWIPNFEALVRYSDTNIPPDAGILLLPGEDAFYYATGRKPQFPVLLFDHTVNPYSPEQIREICRERNITWLIVKQDLQNEEDAVDEEKDRITAALEDDFEQIESLKNYDIYRRLDPNAKKDSDDDDDDDGKP